MKSNLSSSFRRGFTLIELLVVIAIIAILAAILFPVFAQAKAAAKSAASLSNTKQVGTAFKLYMGDNEDTYPVISDKLAPEPAGSWFGCLPNIEWGTAAGGWAYVMFPYTKNGDIFAVPASKKPYWLGQGSWGWCPGDVKPADPVLSAMSDDFNNKVKNGVQYMYRKAYGGASRSDFAGSPITDSMAAYPANNFVNYEYASWSTNPKYTIWGSYPTAELQNMALNVVFMDGHSKKVKGGQFRHLRYNLNNGYAGSEDHRRNNTGKNGMDLDWFLTPEDPNTGRVENSATPANDTKDVD